ncbi:MAG: hypothetical protein ABH861_02715 [Patescibacteria group bacterium]|nr:hypothetical protein [Patescibacteria group bacterium]
MLSVLNSLNDQLSGMTSEEALIFVSELDCSMTAATVCIGLVCDALERHDIHSARDYAAAHDAFDATSLEERHPGFGYVMIAVTTDTDEDFDQLLRVIGRKEPVERALALGGTLMSLPRTRISEAHADRIQRNFVAIIEQMLAQDMSVFCEFVVRFERLLSDGDALDEPVWSDFIRDMKGVIAHSMIHGIVQTALN